MPRRKAQEAVEPEGGWRVVGKDDPEAYPLCVVFDLEYVPSSLFGKWADTQLYIVGSLDRCMSSRGLWLM